MAVNITLVGSKWFGSAALAVLLEERVKVLRVVVPVNSADPLEPLRFLQVIEPVPKQLQQDVEKVEGGYRDYQEISFSRTGLKRLYAVTLTLTLLLALLSALGLAVVLSEQFSRPLGLLAEGTRAVVGEASRLPLLQEPDPLLGERQRRRAGVRATWDRGQLASCLDAPAQRRLDDRALLGRQRCESIFEVGHRHARFLGRQPPGIRTQSSRCDAGQATFRC